MGKKAKAKYNPCISKKPRTDSDIINPLQLNPTWQFSYIDIDGPWGWKNIDKKYFFDKIVQGIINFESMKWSEILGRNNHEVNIDQIDKKAQKRLKQLNLDDIETLVSLRIMGAVRIWGIRVHNSFKVLWWDPKHQICTSKLKHT